MKIISFQVKTFRNIVDSNPIKVDPSVTCMVGKNEAGKSALLEALYLLNPAYGEKFNHDEQYPRWLIARDRKAGDLSKHSPIKATFNLDAKDIAAVVDVLGEGVLADKTLTIKRNYGNERVWEFKYDGTKAIQNLIAGFPSTIAQIFTNATTLEQIKETLATEKKANDNTPDRLSDLNDVSKVIKDRGLETVGIYERILNILAARLPVFFRFSKYSTLPGRVDFQKISASKEEGPAQSELQTVRALLQLAGTDLNQLGNNDYELRKGELEAVQIDLTRQVFEYWKQNPYLEVLIDVDKETVNQPNGHTAVARYLDIRLRDKRTGYSNNFSQRSSGFQWFFSFLAAFSEFENKESPIVLLDEPALTLHGKAQGDFLRFINERLAPSSPTIYTTHSPFMIDKLERVRVVEDDGPPRGATSTDEVLARDPDSLFPLQAALGYDIAQNLFVGPHNLVVEGSSDFIYLTIMSILCAQSGRNKLDDRWRVLPAGGATNIPTFVSLVGPHLDITVLADSDTKGMQRVMNMITQNLLKGHRLIMANVATGSKEADIEDLFSEGDYLKLYNKTFGSSIKVSDLPANNRIVKRIEAHIQKEFNHNDVAETLLRSHHEISFTDTSLDRFSTLIKAINDTMNT